MKINNISNISFHIALMILIICSTLYRDRSFAILYNSCNSFREVSLSRAWAKAGLEAMIALILSTVILSFVLSRR
ncbi:MAG: hypothetical protein GX175_03500 [Halanaerobiaceae bacterium]|nr:hypothetical protein [Halanaerobiaceae bacterium]